MDRQELIAPLIKSVRREIGDSSGFEKVLPEWDIMPLIHKGEHAGTIMIKGTEIHFAKTDKIHTGSVRKTVRETIKTVMDKYGFLTTKAPLEDLAAAKFIKRIGFNPTWKDEIYQYYLLAELPWSRSREV